MGPARVALLLGMATVPSGLAYDLEPSVKAHNHACIDWADSAAVAVDGVNPVEVTPGIRLCRTRQVGRDASELASVLDGERDGTCRGNPEYEVATRSTEATVFWHRQNFNALPLPLMTWFGAAGLGVVPMGICRANASIGDTVSWRLGVLHGAGKNYATCQLQDGDLIAGNFDLLGAYNRTVPYVPVRLHLSLLLTTSRIARLMLHIHGLNRCLALTVRRGRATSASSASASSWTNISRPETASSSRRQRAHRCTSCTKRFGLLRT